MENGLKGKIQSYLDSSGLTIRALERQAGLKTNAARNILRGQSKNPTAVTLQALADVMGCSVSELLGTKKEMYATEIKPRFDESPIVEHPELIKKIVDYILKTAAEQNYNLSIHQASVILEEVYSYTVKKNPPNLDMVFVDWYLKKAFR